MEYKICENCQAKLHARTLRCPNCNTILTEASKVVSDTPEPIVEETVQNNDLSTEFDVKVSDNEPQIQPTFSETVADVKDYVYKAEVHHSLEYTKPLSNFLKVILTALSVTPMFGQLLGVLCGLFFVAYDDNDRNSFGKALIVLSIFMFIFYISNIMMVSELFADGELTNYLNNLIK